MVNFDHNRIWDGEYWPLRFLGLNLTLLTYGPNSEIFNTENRQKRLGNFIIHCRAVNFGHKITFGTANMSIFTYWDEI